jgi:uncharacterized protein
VKITDRAIAASAFACGLIFALGLLVSGMANPAKVLAFLDLAGSWDPSLGLVMVGATAVAAIGYAISRSRQTSWLGEPLRVPSKQSLDRRLILGSFTFGVGWGLAGFCPGPVIVAAGAGEIKAFIFLSAMLLGMWLFEKINPSAV